MSIWSSGGAGARDFADWRFESLQCRKMKWLLRILSRKRLTNNSEFKRRRFYSDYPTSFLVSYRKRLLKIIVALWKNFILLKVLLSMKCTCFTFKMRILHINFVPTQNSWYISISLKIFFDAVVQTSKD